MMIVFGKLDDHMDGFPSGVIHKSRRAKKIRIIEKDDLWIFSMFFYDIIFNYFAFFYLAIILKTSPSLTPKKNPH
jgi:hypothetical protein